MYGVSLQVCACYHFGKSTHTLLSALHVPTIKLICCQLFDLMLMAGKLINNLRIVVAVHAPRAS